MRRILSLCLAFLLITAESQAFGQGKSPPSLGGSKAAKLPPPVEIDTLPPTVREALNRVVQAPTLTAMARAESRPQAMTLLLMSPEFQRR